MIDKCYSAQHVPPRSPRVSLMSITQLFNRFASVCQGSMLRAYTLDQRPLDPIWRRDIHVLRLYTEIYTAMKDVLQRPGQPNGSHGQISEWARATRWHSGERTPQPLWRCVDALMEYIAYDTRPVSVCASSCSNQVSRICIAVVTFTNLAKFGGRCAPPVAYSKSSRAQRLLEYPYTKHIVVPCQQRA
jgi:hypothetical protein